MPHRLFALALLALATEAAVAQSGLTAEALSQDLRADQQAHLWRVGAWGLANAVGGTALFLASDAEAEPWRRAFGMQVGAWGVINTGIAVVGLATGTGDVTADWGEALRAENGYADILLVNQGLNVGYAAVGATLWAVSGRGVSNPDAWRGHGQALILQGAGLFVLDGIAYVGTRARLGALVDLAQSASVTASANGVALVIPL
ncbi:MAG: hypothetical protein AAF791_02080 [Bacteroidota bacterium]